MPREEAKRQFRFLTKTTRVDLISCRSSSCILRPDAHAGNHGIIASKRCDHLLVENNVSYDNAGSGIMLHKSCDDSIVRGVK